MAQSTVTHFPSHLSRNILKELDVRFWTITLVVFVVINSLFYYSVVNPIQLTAEDKQAFIRKLYRVDRSVIADLEAKKKAAIMERQREEQKKEEVKEEREERKQMTDEERAQARKQSRAQREATKADRRMRAAKKFVAAGVAKGGEGIGRSGRRGARGAGDFGISGTGGRGIISGEMSSLGGGPRFVQGEAYVEGAEGIDITATEDVEIASGEITGGMVMEEIEKPTGAGAAAVSRKPDALLMVIEPQLSSLQRCYERYRKKDPQLNGRIVIKFTIDADGSVSRITIDGRWSNPPIGVQVEECIRNRIEKRWRFDSIQEGDTQVEVPISFK